MIYNFRIHPPEIKNWDEITPIQKEFDNWEDVVQEAYTIALENKTEVRVNDAKFDPGQGHYFHWQSVSAKKYAIIVDKLGSD